MLCGTTWHSSRPSSTLCSCASNSSTSVSWHGCSASRHQAHIHHGRCPPPCEQDCTRHGGQTPGGQLDTRGCEGPDGEGASHAAPGAGAEGPGSPELPPRAQGGLHPPPWLQAPHLDAAPHGSRPGREGRGGGRGMAGGQTHRVLIPAPAPASSSCGRHRIRAGRAGPGAFPRTTSRWLPSPRGVGARRGAPALCPEDNEGGDWKSLGPRPQLTNSGARLQSGARPATPGPPARSSPGPGCGGQGPGAREVSAGFAHAANVEGKSQSAPLEAGRDLVSSLTP